MVLSDTRYLLVLSQFGSVQFRLSFYGENYLGEVRGKIEKHINFNLSRIIHLTIFETASSQTDRRLNEVSKDISSHRISQKLVIEQVSNLRDNCHFFGEKI